MKRKPQYPSSFKPLPVQPTTQPPGTLSVRTCDGCSACCIIFRIDELNKPMRMPCSHLSEAKDCCTIYEKRPPVCRDYLCQWRGQPGLVPFEFKPSECGFIVTYNPSKAALLLYEMRPGAFDAIASRMMPWVHNLRRSGVRVGLIVYEESGSHEDLFLFEPLPRHAPDLSPTQIKKMLPSALIARGVEARPYPRGKPQNG